MQLSKSLFGLVLLVSALLVISSTGPASAGMGGPDDFGYVWIDSDEPGGPTYSWVDITNRGTQLYMSDDDNQPISMPFSFNFYGNSFSGNLRVCSNGWVSFTSTSTRYSNDPIPDPDEPNNLLAMFWDDLNPSTGGQIWYFGNSDSLIVSWIDVPHYYSTGANTFQVILTADDGIHFQFNSLSDPLNECTIGIENSDASIGLQIAYDQGYVHNQLAVDILLPDVMLFCDNLSPQFCQGKKFYFMVTVNNRTGGNISGTLTFSGYTDYGCDPANLLIAIPRNKTYPAGTTQEYYMLKAPDSATPGQYSASIGGSLSGNDVYCCMNADIIDCVPWRIGNNTEWELVQADRPEAILPTVTELHQNYPNPFNATTNISLDLAEAGNVSVKVYDITGRLVITLLEGYKDAGNQVVAWDASNVASGVYFYRLVAGDYVATKSMNLLK
ncbi:MAG: T9SS type A sorting domain-containing protein [Candidatus Zixiibacteriota bacterium]